MNIFKDDLNIILKTLDIPARQLASELDFDEPTICNWLNGKYEPDVRSKEDIYSYAYENGLRLNLAYEEPLNNLAKKQGFVHLYHGSKYEIEGEIDINKSSDFNDLGPGFYLGQTLVQSTMFVSDCHRPKVYSFGLFTKNLKVVELDIGEEWAICVAHNRNLIDKYSDSKKVKRIIDKTKDADVIIAPIADNRMINIIDNFFNGNMSIEACYNSLAVLDLGKQYVLKTNKAIKNLGIIKEYFLCKKEIDDYKAQSNKLRQKRVELTKGYISKYKHGKYVDEIL